MEIGTHELLTGREAALTVALAQLIAAPVDHLDDAIGVTLRAMGLLLGMDRAALWRGTAAAPDTLTLVGLRTGKSAAPAPPAITANAAYPWVTAQLLAGKTVAVEDVSQLGPEASVDQANLRSTRDRSMIAVPLPPGADQIRGAISFSATTRAVRLTDRLQLRCELVAQVVASVLGRQRSEDGFPDSDWRLGPLVENLQVGVFVTRHRGTLVQVNPMMAKMIGYESVQELLATPPRQLWADPEQRDRCFAALAAKGTLVGYEADVRRRDGSVINVSLNAVQLPGELVVGAMEDVTERKRSAEALRASEERFRSLVEFSGGVIEVVDRAGVVSYQSPNSVEITGFRPADRIGHSAFENVHREDRQRAEGLFAAVLAGGEGCTRQLNLRAVRADQSVWWVAGAAVNRLAEPSVRGVILNFHDVTEQKSAEFERNRLQAMLHQAQKMESVGRLAGGVAHDFNNMLTVILVSAEHAVGLCDQPDRGSKGARDLKADLVEVQSAARRSADLTRQLLAFARKSTVSPRVLDLNSTIGGGMVKLLGRLIGENVKLRWAPGEDLWPVLIDPSQVDQVLANLCVNARDAIADVGEVTISTGNQPWDPEFCQRHPGCTARDYVRLTVTDNGCGMDSVTQQRIFEPFFTTKAEGKGTGLGLSLVYGAVQQNGGFITVQSAPDQGTEFGVYLPRHQSVPVKLEVPASVGQARGGELVLIVEDEPTIARLVTRLVRELGYRPLTAVTPAEAVSLATAHAHELRVLLTDVVMPEMNGRELARSVAAVCPGVHCLYMSGYTADVLALREASDPAIAFIQKPFTLEELGTSLQSVLKARPSTLAPG